MGIFSRLTDIINANLNAVLDRAEDPEKMARLMVQEMEETLVEVRSAAARSIAEKKELERKAAQLAEAQADWERKAELAVTRSRDDLARGALIAKAKAAEAEQAVRQELVAIDEALAKTNDDMAKLQAKLDEAKQKQKSIQIRSDSAGHQVRMRRQLYDGRIDEALRRYETVERRLDTMEGEAESWAMGRRSTGGAKTLEQEFADLEAEGAVDAELARLKAKIGTDA